MIEEFSPYVEPVCNHLRTRLQSWEFSPLEAQKCSRGIEIVTASNIENVLKVYRAPKTYTLRTNSLDNLYVSTM